MAKYILKIRAVDKIVFNSLVKNEKTIETRAATDKYRKIQRGDILIFDCQGEKLEKRVNKIKIYKNISAMTKEINFRKVVPLVSSVKEMTKLIYSFPKNKEKIKKHGIIAFWLV